MGNIVSTTKSVSMAFLWRFYHKTVSISMERFFWKCTHGVWQGSGSGQQGGWWWLVGQISVSIIINMIFIKGFTTLITFINGGQ